MYDDKLYMLDLDQILKQYKDGDKVKIYIEDGEVKKEKRKYEPFRV
jgi:ribosomal protein L21E